MDQRPFCLSVKALIANPEKQYLVLRRSWQSKNNAGLWDLPGGKCDPGEPMETALRREVFQETGLEVRLTEVVGSAQADLPDRVVAYLLVEAQSTGNNVQLSAEHEEYRWLPRTELAQFPVPEQFRVFLGQYARSGKTSKPQRDFDKDWYREQVDAFGQVQPVHAGLANALGGVLQEATNRLGMHAIVQTRAKTLASFAEKIIRKNYSDPLRQMTDLCGARVITHTLNEVAAVCRFVENHFNIYWDDSGDKLESLAATEFGYLSRHYVVAFKPGVFPESVVPADLVNPDLKAELQVRTILQHAWADINHELSYKNRFRLPRRWQREFARLAAVLEEADRGFESIRTGLGEYASSYGAYYTKEQLRQEIDKLAIVLEADPRNLDIAQQLAKMAMSLENWNRAVQLLEPFAAEGTASLLRDLGVSLCKLHGKDPHGKGFLKGQSYLERAAQLDASDVDAWASLGGTWRKRENAARNPDERSAFRQSARACYRRGFETDPGHPYPLGNYIEYEMAEHPDLDIVAFFRPALETAIHRCRLQAEVGVNLPWVYFDLGKFQLLLRQPYAALGHYAAGVANSSAAFFLDSALASFDTLEGARQSLPGLDWSRDYLRLAKALRFGLPDPDTSFPSLGALRFQGPVIVVSGYCDRPPDAEHRTIVLSAFRGFRGTLISGGTQAGISALVGELQAAYSDVLHTVGYVPQELPKEVQLDQRYSEHRRTSGTGFSPLEPLQYWKEMHQAAVPTANVKLLAIGGGPITTCECQLALSVGVPVAVIDVGDSEAGKGLADYPWSTNPLLQRLPADPGAVRRFLES
jgi:ppGpp synthetase/RelA/SpoT-type nucleotidyltranferase/8-oxo-dGTP pyrophosphatase MutT (NUDIX family)